jgi:two-component system KDP operon response regulator KdpE
MPIRLTKLEDRLIGYMIEKVGDVCSHEELITHVWGGGRNKAVVEKTVNRLRIKLEPDTTVPNYLVSAWGQGYVLQNSVKKT